MPRLLCTLLLLLLAAPLAGAHPLLQCEFDRKIAVRLEPAAVDVKYTLELSEWSMVFDGKTILKDEDLKGITGERVYSQRYAARKAKLIADAFIAQLNGENLKFAPVGEIVIDLEGMSKNILMTFHFRAPYRPDPDRENVFTFADHTVSSGLPCKRSSIARDCFSSPVTS